MIGPRRDMRTSRHCSERFTSAESLADASSLLAHANTTCEQRCMSTQVQAQAGRHGSNAFMTTHTFARRLINVRLATSGSPLCAATKGTSARQDSGRMSRHELRKSTQRGAEASSRCPSCRVAGQFTQTCRRLFHPAPCSRPGKILAWFSRVGGLSEPC